MVSHIPLHKSHSHALKPLLPSPFVAENDAGCAVAGKGRGRHGEPKGGRDSDLGAPRARGGTFEKNLLAKELPVQSRALL